MKSVNDEESIESIINWYVNFENRLGEGGLGNVFHFYLLEITCRWDLVSQESILEAPFEGESTSVGGSGMMTGITMSSHGCSVVPYRSDPNCAYYVEVNAVTYR